MFGNWLSQSMNRKCTYHDLAPLLLVVPATSQQHGTVWAHRHSAAPASPPALCLHSIVCNTHCSNIVFINTKSTKKIPRAPSCQFWTSTQSWSCRQTDSHTCTSWGDTSCLESCAGLWTGWHCGEPSLLSAASLRESTDYKNTTVDKRVTIFTKQTLE